MFFHYNLFSFLFVQCANWLTVGFSEQVNRLILSFLCYVIVMLCQRGALEAWGPSLGFTGADFRRAMVATAPGEKLLIGRRPMRNWTRRTISSLFLCRKLHPFLAKSTKTAANRAALVDLNVHQTVGWGSNPDPTGELIALLQTPYLYLGGLLLKEGERRGRREFILCPRKKKKSRVCAWISPHHVIVQLGASRANWAPPHIHHAHTAHC